MLILLIMFAFSSWILLGCLELTFSLRYLQRKNSGDQAILVATEHHQRVKLNGQERLPSFPYRMCSCPILLQQEVLHMS